MLILLPCFTVLLLFLTLLGSQEEGVSKFTGKRVALIQAVLITGVFIVLQSEILSLFKKLDQPFVIGAWSLALLALVAMGLSTPLLRNGWKKVTASHHTITRLTVISLTAYSVIFILLLVIVLIAPPSNTDSLRYHMSRVMHWVQDRSLAHYPTSNEPQLVNPIGAELAILQLRLFLGNDRLASLPQWISMVLCTIVVTLGAKLLGAGRKGQLAAAAFAISIPMGILQATSTQNDYVTTLWLVIIAVLVLFAWKHEPGWPEVLSIAAALGLGMLTKGTLYPFAVPWVIWLIASWLRQCRWSLILKRGLVVGVTVIIINAGYWARNLITYHGPLGPSWYVSSMTSASNGILKPFISNLVKDITLNLATPSYSFNDRIANFIHTTFRVIDPDAVNFNLYWRWNQEDIAGNPIHLFLVIVLITAILIWFARGKIKEHHSIWYTLAAISSFVLFVLVTHFDRYGTRYQLPLLVIWAPVFGMFIATLKRRWLVPTVIGFLIVISMPFVIFNSTRPLIAMKNGPEPYAIHILPGLGNTRSSSLFFADQQSLIFANWPEFEKPYTGVTQDIRKTGCDQVGLRIDSSDLEYFFWWLLSAPQSGVRIEYIYYSDLLGRYADSNFKPCAIICTICGDRTRIHGLNLFATYDNYMKLFVGTTYNPDKDK